LLLKNLARAYELYGQKRQAVVALETFLVREPNAADRDQIQRRIEVLKKQIASEKAAPPTTTTPAANTTTPAPTEPPPTQQSPAPLAADHAHGGRPVLALVVTGVGGVVLIVGVAVYAKAAKDTKNFEDQCPNRVCDTSKMGYQALIDGGNDARSREITGGVVTGIGAATVAGGLLWYFLAPHGGGTSATASAGTLSHPLVTPAVSPGFSGVSLSGAF
jgi:hypothetical protein